VLDVAVVGGINIDLIALLDRQPDDDHPALIQSLVEGPGGKGANQAVAAARLGASVRLLGAVGDDDDGARAVHELAALDVDCRAVRAVPGQRTGRVVGFVTAAGSKRTAADGGANLHLTPDDVRAFETSIAGADVVIVQLEPPPETVRAVLQLASAAGVPTLLDLAPAQGPVRDLFPLATWVTGNHSEVETATSVAVHDEASARVATGVILAAGPVIAGVTVHAAGQLVSSREGAIWSTPARDVDIVDTTGAGDAFAATLAVRLAEGASPDDAAQWASTASTLACRRLGAQAALPTRVEIEAAR
jgi:ribokinase